MRSLLSLVVLLVHLLLLSFHVRPLGDLVGLFTVGAGLVGLLLGLLERALLLGARVSNGSSSSSQEFGAPRYARSFTPLTPACLAQWAQQ